MTKGKAHYALNTVSYNPFYEKSIKSIFGDVYICEDA
jgi:chromosome segregation ATPase